ncbi:hypothetical protein CEXT_322971 [Caerostris extrusa]|uniref:Uncharacterized protein n=1 Tax=Caerostris extrusa TaxID=172846 RepID=A0AAV4N2D7_CAEEX|nr:hypothetical protein CEXT_322971 [Caerostris extrusa]
MQSLSNIKASYHVTTHNIIISFFFLVGNPLHSRERSVKIPIPSRGIIPSILCKQSSRRRSASKVTRTPNNGNKWVNLFSASKGHTPPLHFFFFLPSPLFFSFKWSGGKASRGGTGSHHTLTSSPCLPHRRLLYKLVYFGHVLAANGLMESTSSKGTKVCDVAYMKLD